VKKRVAPVTCGAKKRQGGLCSMPAGWGTNHVGVGHCRQHSGNTPTHVKSAASAEYRKLLGTPVEINPVDALLMCIKIRAGEIKWLSIVRKWLIALDGGKQEPITHAVAALPSASAA
jgi:hypothetical protein